MDKVEIFTDGSCKGNPGPGGWGAWIIAGGWDAWELAGRPVSYEKELCMFMIPTNYWLFI